MCDLNKINDYIFHLRLLQIHEAPIFVIKNLAEKTHTKTEHEINKIKADVLLCNRCMIDDRNMPVCGDGNPDAEIMIVGEAPGDVEDFFGMPFVGDSGKLLMWMIKKADRTLQRQKDFYITNTVKCRPPVLSIMQTDRIPQKEQIDNCIEYLKREIEVVKPKVIIALGRTATETVLYRVGGLQRDENEKDIKITQLRGKIFTILNNILVMPTLHPSYILRTKSRDVEALVIEDISNAVKLCKDEDDNESL